MFLTFPRTVGAAKIAACGRAKSALPYNSNINGGGKIENGYPQKCSD
jgi:hypothetical protein